MKTNKNRVPVEAITSEPTVEQSTKADKIVHIHRTENNDSVDLILKHRIRANELLSFWKRKLVSADKKVRKYRQSKRQYTQKLIALTR